MRLYTLIGMYLFIVGALLSVFDGIFLNDPTTRGLIFVLLIFTGALAGLLNVSEDEEHHFLLAAGVFILAILGFHQAFESHGVLGHVSAFFTNAVTFVGSMAAVVALKSVIEFGSQNYRVSPVERLEEKSEEYLRWNESAALRRWNFIVFLAVAVTFLILLLSMPFYEVGPTLAATLLALEWVVIAIFIIDLFVLYRREHSFLSFLRNCWVDIIAAVPVFGIYSALKLVRVARMARLARVGHSFKFFTEKSGAKRYISKPGRTTDIEVAEHPKAGKAKRKKR